MSLENSKFAENPTGSKTPKCLKWLSLNRDINFFHWVIFIQDFEHDLRIDKLFFNLTRERHFVHFWHFCEDSSDKWPKWRSRVKLPILSSYSKSTMKITIWKPNSCLYDYFQIFVTKPGWSLGKPVNYCWLS